MRSIRPFEHAKSHWGAYLMKFHQIRRTDVCAGCSHPRGAQARHVPVPCIASTAPAITPTAAGRISHRKAEPSLGAHTAMVAGSAPAPRSTPATAAGFSPLAPLHGTVPRWPSQRIQTSRKSMAQVSLDSSRQQRHLSTTYVIDHTQLSTCMPLSLERAAKLTDLFDDGST
jgi:hypothetical protein